MQAFLRYGVAYFLTFSSHPFLVHDVEAILLYIESPWTPAGVIMEFIPAAGGYAV